jgi:hypothetical protein
METYTLKSKARPSTLRDGQETRLYDVMEELGGGPLTFETIVKQCEYRRYQTKTETVSISVAWHLRRWLKDGIVQKSSV